MPYKIIADSGCDTTPEIREELELIIVPLNITLTSGKEQKEYTDTPDLDITAMLDDMKQSVSMKTSCPSVSDYAEHMYEYDECFIITIAGFLSGSYNSAVVARDMVLEEFPDKKIYVFDSLNASAGELRLTLYVHELITAGYSFEEIIDKTEHFIDNMATVLVLEDLGNLIKNGRMSKMAERVASLLNIYPVLYKRKFHEIRMAAKVRGLNGALSRMIEYIDEWTENKQERSLTLTLSHCEARSRALAVRKHILEKCRAVNEVVITPVSGLSAVYANRGGIVISFEADPV